MRSLAQEKHKMGKWEGLCLLERGLRNFHLATSYKSHAKLKSRKSTFSTLRGWGERNGFGCEEGNLAWPWGGGGQLDRGIFTLFRLRTVCTECYHGRWQEEIEDSDLAVKWRRMGMSRAELGLSASLSVLLESFCKKKNSSLKHY